MWPWRTQKTDEENTDRELRSHLDLEAEELQAEGLPAAEARYAALRAFGNTTLVKEELRNMSRVTAIEPVVQDVWYALRGMRRNPGFTTVAVLSLALGIGANTAIFTFVNAALLKPLPYPSSDRIVAIRQRPLKGGKAGPVHPRSFLGWRERARSFDALAIAQTIPVNTRTAEGAEQIQGLWASSELFRIFGARPMLGRLFADAEGFNRANVRSGFDGATSVVVLSHNYWQRRFGADSAIVGKTVPIERGTAVIVGVLPAGFRIGSHDIDIYLPLPLDREKREAVGSRSFECYALLRPGVTLKEAQAEMAVIAAQVAEEHVSEREWRPAVLNFRDYLVEENRLALLVLLSAVVFVLLIACANVAGLLLTRGIGRRHELALRASLGAGRGRLVQQLLVENVTLAILGGTLGLIIGAFASRALVWLASDAVAFGQLAGASLDASVLTFTLLLSLISAIAFGLAPAWQVSRFDLQTGLREHGRSASDTPGQHRLRSTLVAAEVALAVTLLITAGLLLRTFAGLLTTPLGFQPKGVLTMRTLVLGDPARRWNLIQSILDRVEILPDVRAAGAIQFLPLSGFANRWTFRFIERPQADAAEKMQADGATVTYGYLPAMGIPVLRGRDFSRRDGINNPRVALVNEAFVRKYLPTEDPIGLHIVGDWADAAHTEIVGVVGDIRHNGLTNEPVPTILLSQSQSPGYITFLAVRTDADPGSVAAAIRREVREVAPFQPLTAVQSMEQYVSVALARPRLYAALGGVFACFALLLASIGLYGLIAYTVSRRTQEIGIRIALGAQPNAVLRSLLAYGLRLTMTGLVIGLICAAALGRFLESLLYGVSTGDAITWIAGSAVLATVALIAMLVPARRVLKVNPIAALRYE
jgi:putative ABC transport system permease protein